MMKSLARNRARIEKRVSLVPGWDYVGLLLMLAVLCLSPVMGAQQAVTTIYPLLPKYEVLGVVYAPPGDYTNSFVSYNESKSVGSAHSQSFTASTTQMQTSTTTSGFSVAGLGWQTQDMVSSSWLTGTESTTSLSVTSTSGNGIEVTGPSIGASVGVDHDFDMIALWLNPVLNTTLTYTPGTTPNFSFLWTGFQYNGCELSNSSDSVNFYQLISGCDPLNGLQPDVVLVPVWCLKNPYSIASLPTSPSTTCAQWWVAQGSGQQENLSRYWDENTWGPDPTTGVPLGPGLTVHDLADILRADPYVTQTLVADNYQAGQNPYTSPCHPTYGLDFNPDATETIPNTSSFSKPYSGTWPLNYCGPAGTVMARQDNQNATVQFETGQITNGTLQRTVLSSDAFMATSTNTYSQTITTTNSFDFTASLGIAGISTSLLSAGFNFSTASGTGYSSTDTQSYSNTNTEGTTSSANWQITGPAATDNYAGPKTFNVYDDNVYGTFSFWSPQTLLNLPTLPTSSPIGVKMTAAGSVKCVTATTCNFGSITVGKSSGAITVTLTNQSPYQMTMVSPSLSFSDVAPDASSGYSQLSSFVIVSGSDLCAGKLLAAAASCTVKIEFKPRLVDAPNTEQASYPVAAYMVAAATEGIPFFSGATCSTGWCSSVLVTNTVINVTGPGAETFTAVSGTAVPAATSCTGIKPSCDVGATLTPAATVSNAEQGQSLLTTLTFKNYYNDAVTISSGAGKGVVLRGPSSTDAASYSVPSSTDHCSGETIQPLGTCTVNIQFSPVSSAGAGSIANTQVSVVGVANGASPAALAQAGISTTVNGLLLQSNRAFSECVGNLCNPAGTTYAYATFTNTSSVAINNTTISPPLNFQVVSSTCSSVAAGGGCYVELSYTQSCTPVAGADGLRSCTISGHGTTTLAGKYADTGDAASLTYNVSGTYRYDNLTH